MSKKRATETGDRLGHGFQKPAIIAAVFLGLHILHLFWRPNPMWGVDFLFYLPASVQGLFILLAVLLFVPAFRRQIRSMGRRTSLRTVGARPPRLGHPSLVLLLALAAFITLLGPPFPGRRLLPAGEIGLTTWHDSPGAANLRSCSPCITQARPSGKPLRTRTAFTATLPDVLYVLLAFPVADAA